MVEIGATDTLAGMARRTLAATYGASDAIHSVKRQVFSWSKDQRDIYYDIDPVDQDPEDVKPSQAVSAKATSAVPAPALAPASTPAASPATIVATASPPVAGSTVSFSDEPVTATEIVRALIAQKQKKSVLEIPAGKSIKALSGGKYETAMLRDRC